VSGLRPADGEGGRRESARPGAGEPIRIALLSPYTGANLGDAAIQTAAIEGLRRRLRTTELTGIYLDPQLTAQRHGIPCRQITGFPLAYYAQYRRTGATSAGRAPRAAPSAPSAPPVGAADGWRAAIKNLPVVGPVLRGAVMAGRQVWGLRREPGHVARSFWFARSQRLIVAAGGGQLDEEWGGPWGHPYALFRWALVAWLARVPFVVISVGVGYLNLPLSRWFVRGALRLAAYRSYRDEGSKRLLQGLRFTGADPCVPDLAFGLPSPPRTATRPPGAPRRVGVSPIAYGDPALWPTDKAALHRRYAAELERFVRWLGSRGYEVTLFATSATDVRVVDALLEALADGSPAAAPAPWLRRASDERLENLMGELARLDCVVASRLHGVVLSHLAGNPVVAVSFDRKVDAHMAEVGHQRYCLSISSVEHAALQEAFEALEREEAPARARIAAVMGAYHAAVAAQFDTLARLATREGSHR
jgi:polysaccharide pyruvyl transferase WcaK-like protein